MSRRIIRKNQNIIFQDNFYPEDLAQIPDKFNGTLIVLGNAFLSKENKIDIPCSMRVQQNLYANKILIRGDFLCTGDVVANKIIIDGFCRISGKTICKDMSKRSFFNP